MWAPSALTVATAPLATDAVPPSAPASVALPRPERPPSAVTLQLTTERLQASAAELHASAACGAAVSILMVSSRHAEAWPTSSTMRVRSVCSPSPVIVTFGSVDTAPPSIVRSM